MKKLFLDILIGIIIASGIAYVKLMEAKEDKCIEMFSVVYES